MVGDKSCHFCFRRSYPAGKNSSVQYKWVYDSRSIRPHLHDFKELSVENHAIFQCNPLQRKRLQLRVYSRTILPATLFVSFTHLLCKNESLRPKNVSYITNIVELSPDFSV